MIRPLEDWIACLIVGLIALAVVSLCSCDTAHADQTAIETIILEAQGESLEGQIAVAEVIRNRAFKANKTFKEVCIARRQFSCWNSLEWAKNGISRASSEVYQRASRAWHESEGLNRGFTHYHAVSVHPYWAKGLQGVKIGNHVFYKGVK